MSDYTQKIISDMKASVASATDCILTVKQCAALLEEIEFLHEDLRLTQEDSLLEAGWMMKHFENWQASELQVKRLRSVIEAVEGVPDGYGREICPWCKHTIIGAYSTGHAEDCTRQMALGETTNGHQK